MFRLSQYARALLPLVTVALTIGACDREKEVAPEIIEVPVPVLSASVAAAPTALPEPKRYSEEREHKGLAKVRVAELPVTYEAKPDAQIVTKLVQGAQVTRLVDVGAFSLVEYTDGAAKKLGWVAATGLDDESNAALAAASASGTSAAPTAAATTQAPHASAAPATSVRPASSAPVASAAASASSASAAPAASGKVRRGRLGR